MGHDPVLVRNTRDWLVKSSKDLRLIDIVLSADPPACEDALFHCQQAAEKALKAFLTWHDQPFDKTHDLGLLARQCAAIDSAFEVFAHRLQVLTPYAWMFRYPPETPEPTLAQAEQGRALAREVVGAVLSRLPEAVRPTANC